MNLEQYSQLLIAKPKDFVPSASQIEDFLSAMQRERVVPGKPAIAFRTLTGKTREYPIIDPLTEKNLIVELSDHRELKALSEIPEAAKGFYDYDVEIAGIGRPKLPPLPIDFEDKYFVTITCFVFSQYRSTSDWHDYEKVKDVTPYRKLCLESPPQGIFTNPYNMETIRVPEAGYARFWLQFELGKFLVPEIYDNDLNILNPRILAIAEQIFNISFVQGCYWG